LGGPGWAVNFLDSYGSIVSLPYDVFSRLCPSFSDSDFCRRGADELIYLSKFCANITKEMVCRKEISGVLI